MEVETNNNNNVIFEPQYIKLDKDEFNKNSNNINNQSINASSMITYSKIVCCICGVVMDANNEGICEACAKKNIDITTGITKVASLIYCRTCERYKRPPWIKVERESQDMMNLCLSKIKGLNKVQLIDSSFVWTEPHSKEIKLKLTIQKELNKSLISTSFIVTFKEDWTQCEDCKKTFTPHIWRAVVQLRQKVNHKRTFLFLEQVILKHKAQNKALNIKEHPEGVDFYFSNRSQANTFCSFIHEFLPCQMKTSRQLISVDEKSNEAEYKETFRLEIAPICQDDLVILNEDNYKKLGSIGPVLLCYKQIKSLKFIDPITFETLDLDNNTYWRYELKSEIDRKCLSEFLILNVEEEIDYKKLAEKDKSQRVIKKIVNNRKNKVQKMELDESKNSIRSNLTNNSKYMELLEKKLEDKKIKIVNVKCIRNSEKEENKEIIEVRTFLGRKMHPGDVYYGYDLTRINISDENEEFLSKKKGKIPDIILVKKKYNNYKRIFKLKHLKMDVDDDNEENEEEEKEENNENKKSKKKKQKKIKSNKNKTKIKNMDKDREEFLKDVGTNKEMREYIKMYKDPKAIEELNKQMDNLGIDEKDLNDSDLDIKIDELLDDVNEDLNKLNLDNKNENNKEIKSDEKDADKIGKRERDGKPIKDD
jgi:nonsense-mediated mRNA decay protein 3